MGLYDCLLYQFGASVLFSFLFGIIIYIKITRKFDKFISLSTPAPPVVDQLLRGHFYTLWIALNKRKYRSITGTELGTFDFRKNSTKFDLAISILNTLNNFLLLGSLLLLLAIDYL